MDPDERLELIELYDRSRELEALRAASSDASANAAHDREIDQLRREIIRRLAAGSGDDPPDVHGPSRPRA